MVSKRAVAILPLLATLAVGGPVEGLVDPTMDVNSTLIARGGEHRAVIYSGLFCSGTTLKLVTNFGCGGTCHTVRNGRSVLLLQETVGNPKPTGDFFSDSRCRNSVLHAGIHSGEHSGCTNSPSPFNSFYLYFNC